MNRYKSANDALHAPGQLKRAVCRPKKRRPLWTGAAALATVIAVFAAVLFLPAAETEPEQNNFPLNTPLIPTANAAEILTEPELPEMVQAPDFSGEWDSEEHRLWQECRSAQWQLRPGDDSALYDFYTETARELLLNSDGENVLYSPLNLYIGLAMLAEVTDGNSRDQILGLLNCGTVEELREFVSALWNVNYCDDGVVKSLLAGSLWLRNDRDYNMDTMQTLADHYYASSHRGIMGSPEYTRLLRDWINENTGNLLSDQINEMELDPETVLTLVSAIYFKAGWADTFSDADTAPDVFHGPDEDVTVDFLHQSGERTYYRGDGFAAVNLPLTESGRMWILLPDEDSSVDALLEGNALDLLTGYRTWPDRWNGTVNLSLPKFDVSCQIDLKEPMKRLGITDVFDEAAADFSPVCENSEGLKLSQALHGARVMIDEDGCTGAAYTIFTIMGTGGSLLGNEIDFTADRPFLFAVTGVDDQILFLGVVNQP